MNLDTLIGFATLFSGRTDAYFDGDKSRTAYYYVNDQRFTRKVGLETFRRHLTGDRSMGTYPVRDDASCRWGCIDIDDPRLKELEPGSDEFESIEQDNYDRATDVQSVWEYCGVSSWIERSRSKGFHVWTFASGWLPAAQMRRAGLYVARVAGLPDGTEVNPKNDAPWLTKTGLVNTVRLPYYGKANKRRMVVTDGSRDLSLSEFVSSAMACRNDRSLFEALSSRFQDEETVKARLAETSLREIHYGDGAAVRSSSSFVRQDAGLILAGKREVLQGERDNQFYTMANVLKTQGTPYELALRMIARIYAEQCPDKDGFSLEDAQSKVRNVYRG